MKTIFYLLLLSSTVIRLADIVYLQLQPETNLPMLVYAVTAAIVLYGIILLVKRVINNLNLRHYMWFYIIQSVAFGFNIGYVAVTCPLKLSPLEIVVTGTFLDILIAAAVVWTCVRRMRSRFVTVGEL